MITSDSPTPRPTRILALDVGKRRIGIAATDGAGILVLPHSVRTRTSARQDIDHLLVILDERRTQLLVMGLPIREDGSEGRVARDARFLAGKLAALRPHILIEWQDEAYSTVEAHERLEERGMSTREQREVVDAVAAQVILESYLARTT